MDCGAARSYRLFVLLLLMRLSEADEGGYRDVLESARSNQGLERLEQIKDAVLERDGSISIIPHN